MRQQLALETETAAAGSGERSPARGGLAGWQMRLVEAAARDDLAGLTVRALARRARLSPDHFARCFQISFGLSPVEWLLQRRLARAKALLTRSDDTVDQIAVATGYRSGSQLARVFRRRVGVSPRTFRRR